MKQATAAATKAQAIRRATAVARRPGRPLPHAQRQWAGTFLNHDLRDLRIHTDDEAARLADGAGVRAFTFGRDIAFGSGAWAPGSAAGDRRIAHELAHASQQRGAAPSDGLRLSTRAEERDADAAAQAVLGGVPHRTMRAPLAFAAEDGPAANDLLPLDLENPYGEPDEEHLREVDEAKQALLAALARYDSIAFLHRLRSLTPAVRIALDGDTAFLRQIRSHLWGKAYWIVQLRLRFGNTQPVYVRQLSLAILSKDGRIAADLLRAHPQLTDPHVVPGVYDVLAYEFRDHPWRATLLRLARERETARRRESYTYREVHYERQEGGGWALERFTGIARYDLARTANELRIVVRLHLVEKTDTSRTYWPTDEKQRSWRNRIEEVWNNRFAANNGTSRLRIVFVPVFTSENPHFTVRVVRSRSYVRSNETEWWENASPSTVAHEFGHMVGNPDEYRLPARISDVPASQGLTPDEARRTTVEGVTGTAPRRRPSSGTSLGGIMGSPHARGSHAERRHVWPILDRYNRILKPADENDYVLVSL